MDNAARQNSGAQLPVGVLTNYRASREVEPLSSRSYAAGRTPTWFLIV